MSWKIETRTRLRSLAITFFNFGLAVAISKFMGPIYGSILIFLFLTILATKYLPSKFFLQNFAISSVLFVGLAPVYLLFRGLLVDKSLTTWDLQIYGITFLFFISLINKLFSNDSKMKFTYSFREKVVSICGSLGALTFLLIIEKILLNRSIGDGVSWIASGDSKNHAANGVSLIEFGDLKIDTFLIQPSSSPSFLSLMLSQYSNSQTLLKSNLEILMISYAHVWIVLIGLLGVTFAATFDMLWKKISLKNQETPFFFLFLSSLLATLSFVLGPALYDGFFTALFGIAALVVLISWFIEVSNSNYFAWKFLLVGALLLGSSIMAWMFVAPISIALFLLGFINILNIKFKSMSLVSLFSLVVTLILLSAVHFSNFGQEIIYKAKLALNMTGAVNASQPKVLFILMAVLVLFGLSSRNSNQRLGNSIVLISVLSLVALLAFKSFSNLSWLNWNYYLLKYQWIVFVVMFILVFSIGVSKFFLTFEGKKSSTYLSTILVILITFFSSELSVSSNRVWQKVWAGWENPRSTAINRMLEQEIDAKNPTLFFHHGYGGDAMLVNFWLTAFADPIDPIRGWNYTIDTTGDPKQMCEVNYYYPTITLVTSDTKLEEGLLSECPEENFVIKLEPPLF